MLKSILIVCLLLIQLQSRQSSEKATPQFADSTERYNNCRGIAFIVLHIFVKYLIAHAIITSLGSQKVCHICLQLVTTTVLHHHITILCPLSDIWLPVFFKFVPYMNLACCLDTNPGTSSLGARPRGKTNK